MRSKYTPKRTKWHHFKQFSLGGMPPNPPSKAHGFAMRSMSLRDMQISKSEKKNFLAPPAKSWRRPWLVNLYMHLLLLVLTTVILFCMVCLTLFYLISNVFKTQLHSCTDFNPIRSGLFQTANDPGGGGALKAPHPPYDLENVVSIFTISYMCILPGVIGMFQ